MSTNLGDRCKDKITGFVGIAIARTEWLYGCVRVTLQPEKLDKGTPIATQTFDEPQLEVLKRGIVANPRSATYGPRDDRAALRR